MKVLVTGGTGFIGKALCRALLERKDDVFVLLHNTPVSMEGVKSVTDLKELEQIDAVVNLAGAPIADKRWSADRKKLLCNSRVDTTTRLVDWIKTLEIKPKVMISGSAVGFYGAARSALVINEQSSPLINDFSSELTQAWEGAADAVESEGVRLCKIRTGVVLGAGGALAKMRLPFLLGGGGPVATGQQYLPWIHIDDEVRAILHLLDNSSLRGAFNLVAPNAVTSKVFSEALGRALKRPAFLPMPEFAVKLMLGGEAAALLTEGLNIVPEALLDSGFQFEFTQIDEAMSSAISQF